MLRTIIVDDESDAVKFIESIIAEYCPNIEIVGTANSAREGVKLINEKEPDRNFFRTHNSHLINLEFVKKYVRQEGGYVLMTNGSNVPISRSKKELFLKQMARLSR